MRRFLGGVTTGLAVGMGGLGALSMVTPSPKASGLEAHVTAPAEASNATPAPSVAPDPAPAPEPPADAVAAAPAPSRASDVADASDPEVTEASSDPSAAPESDRASTQTANAAPSPLATTDEASIAPSDGPAADIAAPATGEAPEVPTVPAASPAPASPADESAPAATPPAAGPTVALADPAPKPLASEVPPVVAAVVASPLPIRPAEAPEVPVPDLAQPSVEEAASPAIPSAETAPDTAAEAVPSTPRVESPPSPDPEPEDIATAQAAPVAVLPVEPSATEPEPEPGPEPEPESEAPATPGRIALEGTALPGRDAVRVNRPGLDPAAEEAPADPVPEEVPGDTPALQRFAASWKAPAEPLPRIAFVLLDDGAAAPEALAALPVPVSVALDPASPGAAERMAAFRDAGLEVLVLAALPPNPQPTDVEVFLVPALATLPEAVAVLDLGQGGLRGRNSTAEMALFRLARAGLGAILPSEGLGSGTEGAEAVGVPAAEILRSLDAGDLAGLERQLDDGARRARQDGEAVLLARPDAATLEALAAWTGERGAEGVAVAPVSALLAP